ncbi:FecR family protein [Magnetospirillum fulvum]|uniref:FecR family protein n=1 Tax=Magnetospirillum fulvum TaxID=1082 RepID=A0A1H6IZV2_MAGFU|nr:FecR domain-containing protein [Magnetospirillum fulvum]SEH55140.1 FecR family protein [Magnetospirillum fulvum]
MIFRSKTRQRRDEASLWVVRLMPGNATVDDLEEFKRWSARSPYHAQAFREARRLWEAAKVAGREVEERTATRLSFPRPANRDPRVGRRAFLGGMATAAAAAGYGLVQPPLGLWPSLSDMLDADYRTSTGERRRIDLAGNVSIEMNTQTSIAMRPGDSGADRIELMSGEGVVTTQAKALEVISGAGRVWGRDAAFNVRQDMGMSKITCLQGTIRVVCGTVEASLGARQQVSYTARGMGAVVSVDPAALTAWRTGFLVFHDTPLRDVVAETNRYRRGRIVLANAELGDRVVNARFHLDRIDDVIEKMANAFGATATSLPGGVVILS